MKPDTRYYRWLRNGLGGAVVMAALYFFSLHSYILFHSIAEIFSVIVAVGIFIIAWNSRRLIDNNYFVFIGIAFLFLGIVDLFHTLAYKGMGVFPEYGANLATQLWLVTRYLESVSFFLAPLFIRRRLNSYYMFFGYGLAVVLLMASIFY